MTDRELLEFIAAQVGNLTGQVGNLTEKVSTIDSKLNSIEKTVLKIEHEHGKKLEVLFDGYKQNTELLEEIRSEVARHEEVILKRVK